MSIDPYPTMTWVPPTSFAMGSDDHYPEEAPTHNVSVHGFWIDTYAVTNIQFAQFVEATNYVTTAETAPNPADYPGMDPKWAVPASVVFSPPPGRVSLSGEPVWWSLNAGADWRHPLGPHDSIIDRGDHPVVHVSWADVEAYATWAGRELPTEAEWEVAARGGLDGAAFAWGDELTVDGSYLANTWQGEFPHENLELDHFAATAPVGSFPPNGYGLYDMIGNTWEWTSDWYQSHDQIEHPCCTMTNPRGASREASIAAHMADLAIPRKVMKGGSYLCAPNYCRRYRPAARMAQDVDTSTCHLGFRCIVREPDETATNPQSTD
ncbi:MAG: formylglycine-generating enzyme family protein [Actinomycetes bacterium]